MDRINIGLIGCGNWGKYILRDLINLGCNVYVAERNQSNRLLAKKNGATETFENLNFLPENLDGYVIAVQAIHHFQVIQKIYSKNKPIFCEKPLVPNLNQIKELEKLNNLRIFTMHKWRYHPAVNKMKEIIDSGVYGKVLCIDLKRKQWGNPHTDVDAVWVLMPHDLSIILHLLNEIPQPVWASGLTSNDNWFHQLYCRLGKETPCTIEVSECYAGNDRSIHILLEKGALLMNDSMANELIVKDTHFSSPQPDKRVPISSEMPLLKELEAFTSYLKDGEAPFTSLSEEIKITETIEKLKALATSN